MIKKIQNYVNSGTLVTRVKLSSDLMLNLDSLYNFQNCFFLYQCTVKCGGGISLRLVRCQDHLGQNLPDHKVAKLNIQT